jgi:hypothetical protein
MEAFVGKVLADTAGTTTTVLAAIGDRLGLFKDVAAHGPATSATGSPHRHPGALCPRVARRHG